MNKEITTQLFVHLILSIFFIFSFFSISYANNINVESIFPHFPTINTKSYILIDYNSNKVLAEMNADTRRHPASLTKMMTSYVIGQSIKSGKIISSNAVTINKNAWSTGNPLFKGSSLMFLKPGDLVSVSQLNRGIILQSGNDACVAMADYISGSQEEFIKVMNQYVKILNLKNTYFKTVHGLDVHGQFSSARDMAIIGKAIIRDTPNEYVIYKEKEFTYNKIRQINRNGLLWDTNLNVDGIKTGHTRLSGYSLVASSIKENMRLISVVLGNNSMLGCENDSRRLLIWGFKFFETVIPLKIGKRFTTEPVWFSKINHIDLGIDKNIYLTIPRGRIKDLKTSYELNHPELYAPLLKSQPVGIIKFQLDGKVIKTSPLVTLREIKEGNIFDYIADYIKLIFYRWFN